MRKLTIILAVLFAGIMGLHADETNTLSISNSKVSSSPATIGSWTVTSDAESYTTGNNYIHAGSGTKKVSHITLETDIFNSRLIKKVQVWGSSSKNSGVTPKVYIGDNLIGEGSEYTEQTATSGGTEYAVTNSEDKTGALKVVISRSSKTSGAIYFNKVTVTYTDGDDQVVNSLDITESSIEVEEGKSSAKLTVTVDPSDAFVHWKSLDESIATVADGVVTGVLAGKTRVVALAGEKSDTCDVTVKENTSAIWYVLADDKTEFSEGDKIMIAKKGAAILMSQIVSYNKDKTTANFSAVTEGVVCNSTFTKCRELESVVYTIEPNGDNWSLKAADGQYLSIEATKKIHLVSSAKELGIAINSSNTAEITNPKANHGILQYNTSAKIFTTYTSGQADVCIYYFHDPDAGKIVCEPQKAELPDNELVDKKASGSLKVTVTGTNITTDGMLIGLSKNEAFSITPASDLPAEGGEITIAYSVNGMVIQAADTTLSDILTIIGTGKNGKTLEVQVPINVKLMKEYFPQSIGSMLTDSIAQMGGVHMQNSTKEITGKDLFLLNEVTVVYKGSYETIVKDATGFLSVNSSLADVAAGDVISGLRGRLMGAYRRYYFKPEGAVIKKTGTATIEPQVFTAMPVIYDDLSRYVKYENIHFNASGNMLFSETTLYCQDSYGFSAPNDTDAPYSVEGIVSINGKYVQLLLTAAPVIDPNYKRPASGVKLDKNELTLNVGKSETLIATVKPDDAFNKNVSWSVDKPEIVKIEQDGKVTAMREGTAAVTVTTEDGNFTATCNVTVTDIVTLVYEKVTDINDLAEGDKVMIVSDNAKGQFAAGKFGTKNFSGVEVKIAENKILSTDAVGATVFTLGKDDDYWTLSDGGKLVGREGIELREGSGNTQWTITVSAKCDTLLCSVESYGDRFIVYNSNSVSLFGAYSSYDEKTMHPVKLYKETGKQLEDIEPTGIIVNPSVKEMVIGSSLQPDAQIIPSNSKYRDVIWESKNPSVATVSAEGLVQAVAVGEAKIVAKSDRDNTLTDTCYITVRDSIHITDIAISISGNLQTEYTLNETKTAQLSAVITPDNADKQDVVWTSSATSIATVNAEGLLTAVEAGEAIITVTALDNGKSAELKVTVKGVPRIELAPTAINFRDTIYKGEELKARDSVFVTGKHLESDMTVSVTGNSFSATPATLPAGGGWIYIDYAVNAGGDFSGKVTLTSGNTTKSATLNLHVTEQFTIAKLLEKEPEKGTVTGKTEYLLGEVTVTYQNGARLYVRDATGSMLLNGVTGEFANGTVLQGMTGVVSHVKYNPQFDVKTQPAAVAGESVDADTLHTYPTRKDLSNYVIVPNVQFKKDVTLNTVTKSADVMFDGGTLTVYNTYEKEFAAVDTKHVYNILGTLMKYGQNVYEVSPIAISLSDEPYMRAEWNSVLFEDNVLPEGGKATGSESMVLDTLNIKEVKIESTGIFSATFADGLLTVSYETDKSGAQEGVITITGVPTKAGAANIVLTIDAYVDIKDILVPSIEVDKDEVVFDSVTVKYLEHSTGSAVVNVTTKNVKNLKVSNSNQDVFSVELKDNKLTITYDVYKKGDFSTIITLKGEAEQAGQKVENVTIRARIAVGEYPEEMGIEKVNAKEGDGIRYNILGQQVDETYHGIVIENGQKTLR